MPVQNLFYCMRRTHFPNWRSNRNIFQYSGERGARWKWQGVAFWKTL